MDRKMKYYLYISDTKIDMLSAQIPKPLLKRIASELSISLKLAAAELGATMKGNQSEETRYSKLKLVVEYIEKHMEPGTVDNPKAYFKGTVPMQWGPLDNSSTVYFGGLINGTILGLGGSLKYVIGNTDALPTQGLPPIGGSPLPFLVDALVKELQPSLILPSLRDPQKPSSSQDVLMSAVSAVTTNMEGPTQKLEFLAKMLVQGQISHSTRVILGTPIYVALAD